ncbi:hypothetical protein EDD18DRAFT_1356956 [Armillaria luteobubalina]|uniref:F-box domain-containing protein n=1 Tax=Armillaria luteobubalina TaxID=153913 RepID=A0AA39PZJ1_9AGAR|nr:hypothetical protein EDD18DRAFT_1356956 [Armillaria luteobubalina]
MSKEIWIQGIECQAAANIDILKDGNVSCYTIFETLLVFGISRYWHLESQQPTIKVLLPNRKVMRQTLMSKGSESSDFDNTMKLWLTNNPSPFHDLISANGIASAKDTSLINDYLQRVHREIQCIEAILKEVQEQKIHLQSIANSHLALISSFCKFPPEVLAIIFQHTITIPPPRNKSPWLPGSMTCIYATLCMLGGICCTWRRKEECENPVSLLKIMLDRSHDADLSIGHSSSIDDTIDNQTLRALVECLLPSSHRWKNASIDTGGDSKDLYEQIQGHLPLLERLELCFMYPFTVSWKYFRAFEDAPRLWELALGKGLSPVQDFPLPWSQITCLYINHHIMPGDLYAVFSITLDLQLLRLSKQDEEVYSSTWDPAATLPSLEDISIGLFTAEFDDDVNHGEDLFYDFLYHSQSLFDQASRLTCLDIALHMVDSTYFLFDALVTTEILPQLQSLKVVCIASEAYHEKEGDDLGEIVAKLFSS